MLQNPIYLNKAGWLSALSWQHRCWPASPVTLSRRVENAKRAGRGQTTPTCRWERSTVPWSEAEDRGRSLGKFFLSKKTLTRKTSNNSVSKCMHLSWFTQMCHPAESELASQPEQALISLRTRQGFVCSCCESMSLWIGVPKLAMMGVRIQTAVCAAQCIHIRPC